MDNSLLPDTTDLMIDIKITLLIEFKSHVQASGDKIQKGWGVARV